MAKLKLHHGLSAAAGEIDKVADDNQFSTYMGPPLTAGVYQGKAKGITYQKTKAGHPMFVFVCEVDEPKGSEKHEYHGAAVFHRIMLPIDKEDKNFGRQAANIKEMLQAIDPRGIAWKGYIDDDFTVTSDDTPKVTVIGKYKHNAVKGSPVKFLVRIGKDYTDEKGNPKSGGPEIRSINALLDGASTGPSVSKGPVVVDDEDEDDTGLVVETEDEFEEDDEVSDDPTDYDEDQEPEKAKAATKKAAAKKAAPRRKAPEPEEEEDDEIGDPDEEELSVVELPDEPEDEPEEEEEEETPPPAPKKRVVKKAAPKKAPEPEPEEDEEEAEGEDEEEDSAPEPDPTPAPRRRRRASTFSDDEEGE